MKEEITFLDMLQQKRTTNEETPHRKLYNLEQEGRIL